MSVTVEAGWYVYIMALIIFCMFFLSCMFEFSIIQRFCLKKKKEKKKYQVLEEIIDK